ncbi:MAG: Flagellin domain protein, partial [Desulfonauticus sp. 38_4375]
HFGTGNDSAEDYYYIAIQTATASAFGLGNAAASGAAGYTISTQSAAQAALNQINEAIVSKDKIRAALGALQNRLENTITNLQIQAENLQAAESRISDVDVATEMTEFVRNQILTQSAVAMLAQANSLPRMAMQLIGGGA